MPWEPPEPEAYAYVLGWYLGDGYVASTGRTYQLVITADTRYFFSNVSADIRGLFCATCDQLGLRWTKSNRRNISISHRASVALLDEHVGPKA